MHRTETMLDFAQPSWWVLVLGFVFVLGMTTCAVLVALHV